MSSRGPLRVSASERLGERSFARGRSTAIRGLVGVVACPSGSPPGSPDGPQPELHLPDAHLSRRSHDDHSRNPAGGDAWKERRTREKVRRQFGHHARCPSRQLDGTRRTLVGFATRRSKEGARARATLARADGTVN
jgi:hypothetical protein